MTSQDQSQSLAFPVTQSDWNTEQQSGVCLHISPHMVPLPGLHGEQTAASALGSEGSHTWGPRACVHTELKEDAEFPRVAAEGVRAWGKGRAQGVQHL
jgi:hypothetical protein